MGDAHQAKGAQGLKDRQSIGGISAEGNWRLETGANLGLMNHVSLRYRFALTGVGPVHFGSARVYASKRTASLPPSTLAQR